MKPASTLTSRRLLLQLAVSSAAGVCFSRLASGSAVAAEAASEATTREAVARDGTKLFIQQSGRGKPIVFLHGWSLNSDIWGEQFAALAPSFRCIGYDRRGHGRSGKPGTGYGYDTLSDDLATVLDHLDLVGATVVAHSMAGGEIVRYLSRHGDRRVSRIILVAATLPRILQAPDNPGGLPLAALDKLRAALAADFSGYVRANARSFFLPDTPQEIVDWGIGLSLQCDHAAAIACTHTYSEVDLTAEVSRLAVPTLILHGDRDALPVDLTSGRLSGLIRGSALKIYAGAPHGLMITHKAAFNTDVADFARG